MPSELSRRLDAQPLRCDGAMSTPLDLVRGRYAGAYPMPSFGRFEVVAEVLDAIR
jgi:hypothetical protein